MTSTTTDFWHSPGHIIAMVDVLASGPVSGLADEISGEITGALSPMTDNPRMTRRIRKQ